MQRAEISSEEAARRVCVDAFVAEACSGRPPSHGLEHMRRVAEEALQLNEEDGCPATPELVHLAGMLHDVADHKYDCDGKMAARVAEFLKENYTAEDAEMAQLVADTVSFSKEKKKGARYYEALLSEPWLRVRNVVSDADKLEALGTVGLERCRHYQLELDPALSDAALYANVVQHCRDKLFRLSDEYMRTPAGMRAAQSKRSELVDALLDWSLQLISH